MSVYSAPLFVIKVSRSQVLIPFMTISHLLLLIPYQCANNSNLLILNIRALWQTNNQTGIAMTTTKTKKTMKALHHSRALLICKMSWITLSTKTSYHIHLKTVNKVTMRKMRIWIRVTIHALKLWTIKFPSRCPTRSKSPIPICQSMKKRQSLAKGQSKSPMVLPYISASTGKAKTYPTLWKLLSRS